MRSPLPVLICAALILGGCATVRDSRLNPFNWFGGSTEETTTGVRVVEVVDPRPMVSVVTEMAVERAPGGAIVRATGLPPRQGYWMAELVPHATAEDAGVLVYEFRVAEPDRATRVGTPPSREVTVGLFLSDQDLAGVGSIVVQGAQNQRRARR